MRELALIHLALLRWAVRDILGRLPGHVEADDLFGYGAIGLIEAERSFEPERGVKFRTFAKPRVQGAILDSLREIDWVSRTVRNHEKRIERARRWLEHQLHRPVDEAEMAEALGLGLREYQMLWDMVRGRRMAPLPELDLAPPSDDTVHERWPRDVREALQAEMDTLPERERRLLELYYGDERTLKEAGRELGISESHTAKIHERTLQRLRARLRRYR